MSAAKRIATLILVLGVAAFAVYLAQVLAYQPFRVPSGSMAPTLRVGDRIAVNHTSDIEDLERGDLVVFAVDEDSSEPVDPDESGARLLVKRVIALPEESVQASGGVVAVNNDERIPEPYLYGEEGDTSFPYVLLEEEEIWVLGDDRDASVDSRQFGPVSEDAIVGRVDARFWPIDRWRVFR